VSDTEMAVKGAVHNVRIRTEICYEYSVYAGVQKLVL
jgi:hypothetical protein